MKVGIANLFSNGIFPGKVVKKNQDVGRKTEGSVAKTNVAPAAKNLQKSAGDIVDISNNGAAAKNATATPSQSMSAGEAVLSKPKYTIASMDKTPHPVKISINDGNRVKTPVNAQFVPFNGDNQGLADGMLGLTPEEAKSGSVNPEINADASALKSAEAEAASENPIKPEVSTSEKPVKPDSLETIKEEASEAASNSSDIKNIANNADEAEQAVKSNSNSIGQFIKSHKGAVAVGAAVLAALGIAVGKTIHDKKQEEKTSNE